MIASPMTKTFNFESLLKIFFIVEYEKSFLSLSINNLCASLNAGKFSLSIVVELKDSSFV